MSTVRRPSGWNMRVDDRVWLPWLNSKDRPKGTKGAKGCEKVGKGRKHESGERQSFGPLEKLEKAGKRKENEGIRHWRTNARSFVRGNS